MHRLLVPTAALDAETPVLPDEARRHLKVVRPKEGEKIELFDGCGAWRVCVWQGGTLRAAGTVRRADPPAYGLTLFACVTKGSRWDWTVEKATELGVTCIVPVLSDRTIVRIPKPERAAKRERWRRIAEDAARQSDAKWLPDIREAVDFRDALAHVRETACFVGALTDPPSRPVLAALRESAPGNRHPTPNTQQPAPNTQHPTPSNQQPTTNNQQLTTNNQYGVFVGPEGDFTPEELAALLEIAVPVSFGSTVLRAETAAIYGVGAVKAYLDSLPREDGV